VDGSIRPVTPLRTGRTCRGQWWHGSFISGRPVARPGREPRPTPVAGLAGAAVILVTAGPVLAQEPEARGNEDLHDTQDHRVAAEVVARDLEHPWGLALLPDGRFLVTERNPGHLRLGEVGGDLSGPLEGVPKIFRYEGETDRSQAGLFDVKLHPGFEENRLVYLSFSKPTSRGAALAVVRGRLSEDGEGPRLEDVQEIFVMKEDDQDSSGLHFGGRMALDTIQQALFLSVGERRNISRAQEVDDQAGSILRMTWEGEPAGTEHQLDSDAEDQDEYIWSWGHRNPQGMAVDPEDGSLWVADHGPEGGDELNRIEEGGNYGWPFFTEGKDYSGAPLGYETPPEGVIPPLHVFDETVAPSGLVRYTGGAFPEWEGDLLVGGLIAEGVVRIRIGPDGTVVDEELMFSEMGRRIRDVQVGADGAVWVISEHSDGEVIRFSPAAPEGSRNR
jgi:aldose sugar dehydrogenase